MRILALADDMTGALEVGAKFSANGIGSVVSTKPVQSALAQAVVFDTETRHLSPELAAEEVKRFVLQSSAICPSFVYKKTDSALRGNIAAELKALAQLYPDWRIGYAPAYPALGRTVKGGILYVDGVAVAETAFANDALNPVRTSAVSAMLDPEFTCTIFDGEVDAHLEEAARTILTDQSMRIAAGPGGLAGTLAEQIDIARGAPPSLPAVRSCLVMNGSRHERSDIQMQHAEAPGWKIVKRSQNRNADAADVANANGKYGVEQMAADDPDALFVIGGDTAFAVIAALGLPPLWPIGEVVPGIPLTRIKLADLKRSLPPRRRDLFLITKAGGFGEPEVFRHVRRILNIEH